MTDHPISAQSAGSYPATVRAHGENEGSSHFDIYRTEQVQLTSTHLGGGDWHWRLIDAAGGRLAHGGGYRDQRECIAAVDALRVEASRATISEVARLRLVGGAPG
jgi:uncharacterized protein YegP (UPF0339 family)